VIFDEGRQFAHFKVIRKLGEGGMGEVYLAEDLKLGRNVALKILQSEFFDDPDRLQRFTREAKTAAKISHANVMAIYDLDRARDESSDRDISYIVMENVSGQTLSEYLVSRTPSNAELLRLSERIAAGLSAAHQLKIVHRDIKSDNIKVDDTGEVKILDFGLAKPLDIVLGSKEADMTDTASNELTQEGKILGTVTYMSPEQARGGPIDTRSDIFSFGILLYRMFSGVSPFEGPDKVSVLAKILEGRQEPLRLKNESIPAELERIIDKCLQKDPNDRYQDTRDLVVDLRSLRRQHDSTISDSSSVMTNAPKFKKTVMFNLSWKKVVLAIAALVTLLAILIMVVVPVVFVSHSDDTPVSGLANLENLGENITRALADQGLLDEDGSIRVSGLPKLPVQANALAILGFDNKTGNTELDWLQAGLPEILLTDLAQSGAMNIIGRSRVLDCLSDKVKSTTDLASHQECVTAARSLGAATVLSGAFYKMGDKIRIDARLEDIKSGQILLAEKVVGDDPFVLVDSLTQKIARSMNVKGPKSADREVADITSSSPEAYREYILGMDKFGLSEYDEANEHFEKAIAIDSNFALPYMRIGMGYSLRNRAQEAIPYFAAAQRFEDRLPIKERSLLDIYNDIWFNQQYDDGMVKCKAFVANYPNDKEARSFYAILLHQLGKDSESALAHLDTVMALDSRFMLALSWYTQIYGGLQDYDKVIEYGILMKSYYPESPESYQILMTAYHQLDLHDEAIATAQELLQKFPDDDQALTTLLSSYIIKRNFDSAAFYTEKIREKHGDDPFKMLNYHYFRCNQEFWKGRFHSGMDELFNGLEVAKGMNDSSRITQAYIRISNRYETLDMKDSSLHYNHEALKWATIFQKLDLYVSEVQWDPSSEPTVRPLIETGLNDFRSRLPQEMWNLADLLQNMFDARCNADTALLIDALRSLIEDANQGGSGVRAQWGALLVLTHRYDEGKTVLSEVLSGQHETTNSWNYLPSLYYMGIAEEALGDPDAAVEAYREVLKYWSDPDVELDEIIDTRERLARLTS